MRFIPIYIVTFLLTGCGFKSEQADLVIHNAIIHALDPSENTYSAMAVRDGKILELGAERQILNKYNATETVDARKQFVFPGFIDAHCHFKAYGEGAIRLDVVGTSSWEEILQKLQEYAAQRNLQPGEWVEGRGWDQNDWANTEMPTSEALDSLFPENPIILRRIDGHAAVINQKALELSRINTAVPVEGGEYLMKDGKFTGVLIDNAVDLVLDAIPGNTPKRQKEGLLLAEQNCFAVGLTTVVDAGLDVDEILLIDSLQQAGELKMRMYVMVSDTEENLDYFQEHGKIKTDRLNVRSFKFYVDGALGSRGACLLSPYADRDTHTGFILDSIAHFRERAQQMKEMGFQMNAHCIGDSANRTMLELYGEMLGGTNDLRWRIEHAQIVHKEDIPLFGKYSVLPSIQPTHATSDMYWAEIRLGRNRMRRAYAYQDLLQENGIVCLGTDFPVEGIDPIHTYYAAVVRKDQKGYPEGGFQADDALSRKEALYGITLWAAIGSFEEEEKGSLEPGKYADFVVLDRNLLTVPEDEMLNTQVQMTFVNGEKVWELQ